jgi:hypothetical protein
MVEDIVEFDVVFEVASTVTEPFIRFDVLDPSDDPRVAVAEVLTLLIATAPPTPPFRAGLSSPTEVADVEKLLLFSARSANPPVDPLAVPTLRWAPVATFAVVVTDAVE